MSICYKTRYRLSKRPLFQKILRRFRRLLARKSVDSAEPRSEWIAGRVAGKSFLDIGCMWNVDGQFAFDAVSHGAAKVSATDINPATSAFIEKNQTSGNKVAFHECDIHDPRIFEYLKPHDLVLCAGVIYHSPNPLHLLGQLRKLTLSELYLRSSIIPEIPGYENAMIHYPYLSDKARSFWRRGDNQSGLSTPFDPNEHYSPWYWGITPSAMRSMLKVAGFHLISERVDGTLYHAICEPASTGRFIPTVDVWKNYSA